LANGAAALAAAEQLGKQGFTINSADIRAGLANTRWHGRLEVIPTNGLPVLLDGAHNHAGARSLCRAVADHFPQKKVIFVLGVLPDKEQAKIVQELAQLAKAVIVTRPDHPRATNWSSVATLARKYMDRVYLSEKIPDALSMAFSLAAEDDLVCVTGSLFLVAEAREVLIAMKLE